MKEASIGRPPPFGEGGSMIMVGFTEETALLLSQLVV